jgi:putative DNA primase/helicase
MSSGWAGRRSGDWNATDDSLHAASFRIVGSDGDAKMSSGGPNCATRRSRPMGSGDGAGIEFLMRSLSNLGDDPHPTVLDSAVRTFADGIAGANGELDDIRLAVVRDAAITTLRGFGVKNAAGVVDAAIRSRTKVEPTADAPGLALADPEPWPGPIDAERLADDIRAAFRRHLALPDGADVALALWALHAHAHDAFVVSPVLGITSPEKRCGKSTLLHVLHGVVPRGLPASNITAASLFRAVEKFRPTLLIDEADTFLRDKEELRGIINSGHTRASAIVIRSVAVGDDFDARVFSTWGPKAIALIGTLPDTIHDRAIIIEMRRRGVGEHVERLRLDRTGALDALRRQAWTWAQDHLDVLRAADPAVPDELHDRARDNWRPLLAIADLIGGAWPALARSAALRLVGQDDDDGSVRTLLLNDLYRLFHDCGEDRLSSAEIVDALTEREDRPWPEWRNGKPITGRGVAKLLKPFGVTPSVMWIREKSRRGYDRADFADAFARYVRTDDDHDRIEREAIQAEGA